MRRKQHSTIAGLLICNDVPDTRSSYLQIHVATSVPCDWETIKSWSDKSKDSEVLRAPLRLAGFLFVVFIVHQWMCKMCSFCGTK
ncbi:hypothetical protein BC832DRAFT_543724 [Gaertneriomyces semiglobifer]|nr:hypothetical protein BC832DRAFT_543724 [Gaertneriomyces semiglobifer]